MGIRCIVCNREPVPYDDTRSFHQSEREEYGDQAIGCVELSRNKTSCIVRGKICPEHRVPNKPYAVSVTVDEKNDKIKKVECHDCAASAGGCKHGIAFLMWLHRRSEEPSPTFPMNEEQRRKWMSVLQIEDIMNSSGVCSDHFELSCFQDTDEYTLKRILKTDAVPTFLKNENPLDVNGVDDETLEPSEVQSECNDANSNTLGDLESANESENDAPETIKRKRLLKVEKYTFAKKEFRFSGGLHPLRVKREDFTSEESWQKFTRIMVWRKQKVESQRMRISRLEKKIKNLEGLICGGGR